MQICNMFFYQALALARSTSTAISSSIRAIQKCICVYKNKTYDLIHLQYLSAKSSATICGKKVFRKARDHFCGRSFLRESFAGADQRSFQQSFLRDVFLQSRAIISAGFSFAMPEHEKLKWKTSL